MTKKVKAKDRPSQRLYDLRAAATYLGRKSIRGVRELVWSGQIPVVVSGRKQYIDVQDMDRFIEANKRFLVDMPSVS